MDNGGSKNDQNIDSQARLKDLAKQKELLKKEQHIQIMINLLPVLVHILLELMDNDEYNALIEAISDDALEEQWISVTQNPQGVNIN